MRFDVETVVFICGMLLVAMLFIFGIAVLFITKLHWAVRIASSALCILTSIAFGAMGYDLWRDQ